MPYKYGVPYLLELLREARGGRCERCHSKRKKVLEFAHIKPTTLNGRGRGQSRRYLDIKRNPTSYRLLCKACHKLFDRTGDTLLG